MDMEEKKQLAIEKQLEFIGKMSDEELDDYLKKVREKWSPYFFRVK